jgi:O-methyltransferase involved in polyketide biosynthesis
MVKTCNQKPWIEGQANTMVKTCNQKPWIEGQANTMVKKWEKEKQWSTKHCTENERSSNMDSTKAEGELRCSGKIEQHEPH